ncbi:MAG: NfeD family protein [Piscirickettsiaceae bacterium]|nr:NfeD family protein [Piscirickettsiaceae bacterium]
MELALDFWHWWVFAVALVIIEILAPSFFALWLAIAAFVTGLALFIMPELQWQTQVLMFAVLSVISIIAWRRYYSINPIETDQPMLNRRGEQYIGRVITLTMPIEDGHGKVQVDDSTWKIEGEDCPAGTKIKVVNVDNVVFQVEIVS